ncbi:MAG: AAA family ATPase, partial [Myxococcota bacterium]
MLKHLEFRSVGPAEEMAITLCPRINVLVGDNGLGKTFILDAAWWALTRTWAGEMLMPHRPPSKPQIYFEYKAKTTTYEHTSIFKRDDEKWELKRGRPAIPGLVLYA